ncbi:acyl-CoA dehydrogenase [Bordetella pertussis]|uniref:Acyl-CoA dehydrogenase, short-chain specific n=3 Tax=Bordetella pertussis TaxID=520 RepID=A0A0E8DGC1_BORPT|nr:acyl-CoA dehydrogenase family protein [Bordetella pertussis]ETH39499.1 acyl-CoA dehydrogenase, C-terminal domain protein [Bordetella pertussis H918]ETH42870.1 acyl-CoA dehydrogenase, C-terminal domain protein [Bordetella pertussis H939]ETH47047.1 acyl-CoA dehydrogenase, C-terminal domain protein [Bordetella pertussis H921]ETH72621.1 acyl-CoA dehydrogenase, C-terminal domain protein [Bordetella pertussis STO1-CHLA-0011]ETH82374.1 acyl-CoA dehydrogenase, C-terminal domain protein [Bordetella 
MQFTHEHRELARTTRRIIAEHLDPYLDEWEAAQMFPAHQVMKALGSAGLLGIGKPAEYGGMALDFSYEMVFAETLGEVRSSGLSSAIGVQSTMCTPALARHGSDALKRAYLAPTIAGDLVGCIGASEASAGSDVSQIKTWARRDGDDYVINGSKMWITNGVQGDWICLLCNTSQEGGPHKNKSLIIVPLDTPGVSVSRKLDKLVLRASDTAELFFDDVRVPVSNRIGAENMGFIYQMEQFQEERMFVAARGMRSMERVIEETIAYAGQRQVFGGTVLSNQVVYHKLAQMQTEIEALRSLLYRAIGQYLDGQDITQLASMAKYCAGRLSMRIPNECLQFWGGQGVMNENWISRAYRDLRQTAIGGGANEIMLEVIAKTMGIHPGKRA